MKNARRGGAQLLLQFVAMMALAGAPEAAVTHTPYQQYIFRSCPAGNTCLIDFPVVPANIRIDLSNASCYIRGAGVPDLPRLDFLQLLTLRADASVAGAFTLEPKQIGAFSGGVSFAANASVGAFAPANQHFQVIARSLFGQMVTLACNLSGERVQLA